MTAAYGTDSLGTVLPPTVPAMHGTLILSSLLFQDRTLHFKKSTINRKNQLRSARSENSKPQNMKLFNNEGHYS